MGQSLSRLAWAGRDLVDRWARQSPARLAVIVFCSIVGVVTLLLALPVARAGDGHRASFVDALFTATSAVCVTGLVTVPTGTYWSMFGHVVILVAIKIGGLGIMTLASIVGLAVSRRLGLTQRLLAAEETRESRLGEVGNLVRAVVVSSSAIEVVLALILIPRFMLDESTPTAIWHGVFYAISTFNNAGFVPTAEGLMPYASDWWVCAPMAVGMFLGALGFPVILNVLRWFRGRAQISLHAKLTIATSAILVAVGLVLLGAFEWHNPATLGALGLSGKLNATFFTAIMPRSGGLAVLDTAAMHQSSWLVQDALMFVGGGSASTGGGIKVTTLAVMLLAIRAEARGDRDVEAFGRRIGPDVLRVAVAVSFVGATFVLVTTLALLAITNEPLDVVLFETISAFGTCGLSLGLTPRLPDSGKLIITALMLASRIGIMTLAAALALRQRRRVIRLPVERPIIG